jgi:integrase/recombinase XerD
VARTLHPDELLRLCRELIRPLAELAGVSLVDRFERLVPPWFTLDHAFKLMDEAAQLPPDPHQRREVLYRDGLILALLSLWPIRRRSLAALTLSRHVAVTPHGIDLLLFAEDTKGKRPESYAVPEPLVSHFRRYLADMRPRIYGSNRHDGLWASSKGYPLSASQIALTIRRHVKKRFNKAMGLHDFRRAAGTSLAMEAPEKVGLTPGILQHAKPETADQHYNLSRSINASRRHGATLSDIRQRLRPNPN